MRRFNVDDVINKAIADSWDLVASQTDPSTADMCINNTWQNLQVASVKLASQVLKDADDSLYKASLDLVSRFKSAIDQDSIQDMATVAYAWRCLINTDTISID